MVQFSSSGVSDSLWPHDSLHARLPYHQLPELTQTHVHWVGDAIQPPHPLSFPSPTAFRVFSNESALHIRWPKYWSFTFSINPFNEYSGLISFRIDKFDLLAVQRDSQESSPTPKFKNINSLALSFFYSPALTSLHDYRKNHSFDCTNLCWQNDVSVLYNAVYMNQVTNFFFF